MKNYLLALVSGLVFFCQHANAQCPAPAPTLTYGTTGTWIGYVYNNTNFSSYAGTINRGSGSMNFDENFGGTTGNWTTSGTACAVDRNSFSVRFLLRQEFHGVYRFIVGADEGVRFSLDGGTTWAINDYTAHTTYATVTYDIFLDGFYDMVIEYYDNSGNNRVSFNAALLCSPAGNQTDYGTTGTWIGYVYNNTNFSNYAGTVNRGGGAMNFDENFGGNTGNWSSGGPTCTVDKSSFSIRFKLRQEFHGAFRFTVGADEGVRFSLDGGATWVINDYTAHTTYRTVTHEQMLDGFYNMVIEYYDNSGANRVSFNITTLCMGTGTQTDYGTNNVWNGYIYDGMDFNIFKGRRNVGTAGSLNFNENYVGSVSTIPVVCPITSETFSARYKLRKTFPMGNHLFTIEGDDGYRLSLDGGATWFINRWVDQPLTTFSKDTVFSGEVFMVLEFYENLEDNILNFSMASLLPITLLEFEGKVTAQKPILQWRLSRESTPDYFRIERSSDGRSFAPIGEVSGNAGQGPDRRNYTFIDPSPLPGAGFYRLDMVDVNGSRKYSSIITINTNIKTTFKIYPTIIDQSRLLFIRSDKNLPSFNVTVVNISGQKIMEKKFGRLSAGQSASVPIREQGLPSGIYVVQVYASGELLGKQKIVVQ